MMSTQLQHLALAYFHQDYDLESGDPDSVIISFVEDEGPAAAQQLAFELEARISEASDDRALRDLWINELGASYDPATDGLGQREWFEHVRRLLLKPLDDTR